MAVLANRNYSWGDLVDPLWTPGLCYPGSLHVLAQRRRFLLPHQAPQLGFEVSGGVRLLGDVAADLRLQQLALFFVLGLIVLVSTFNVASSLVVNLDFRGLAGFALIFSIAFSTRS